MNVTKAAIPDILIIEPKVSGDERGFLFESYNARDFAEKAGITASFVQDNHSRSERNDRVPERSRRSAVQRGGSVSLGHEDRLWVMGNG